MLCYRNDYHPPFPQPRHYFGQPYNYGRPYYNYGGYSYYGGRYYNHYPKVW